MGSTAIGTTAVYVAEKRVAGKVADSVVYVWGATAIPSAHYPWVITPSVSLVYLSGDSLGLRVCVQHIWLRRMSWSCRISYRILCISSKKSVKSSFKTSSRGVLVRGL